MVPGHTQRFLTMLRSPNDVLPIEPTSVDVATCNISPPVLSISLAKKKKRFVQGSLAGKLGFGLWGLGSMQALVEGETLIGNNFEGEGRR